MERNLDRSKTESKRPWKFCVIRQDAKAFLMFLNTPGRTQHHGRSNCYRLERRLPGGNLTH